MFIYLHPLLHLRADPVTRHAPYRRPVKDQQLACLPTGQADVPRADIQFSAVFAAWMPMHAGFAEL